MKVLLVEDDTQLAANIDKQLKKTGFAVDQVSTGEEALFQVEDTSYDCLILDIGLPDISGFEVCTKIREMQITTPILMLTARDATTDRVKGLDIGADDYLTKPADSQELIARVRALIRRNSKSALPLLKVGDLSIDPQTHEVIRQGKTLELNMKEFAVLEYLARHSHEVVTRTMIMEHVWGSDFETLSNVVDVYIRYLRKKIDDPFKKPLIHTIRGGGYSLSDSR